MFFTKWGPVNLCFFRAFQIAKRHLIVGITRRASAFINRYFCYLFGHIRGVAGYCCMPRTKPGIHNKGDSGQGQIGSWVWGLTGFHRRAARQSVSLSLGRHLHMFPVTFDDYMIFLLFTRSWASVFISFSAATCATAPELLSCGCHFGNCNCNWGRRVA